MNAIRRCGDETAEILAIINQAAEAYRGVIPPDRWHEPYMSEPELCQEARSGVESTAANRDIRGPGKR